MMGQGGAHGEVGASLCSGNDAEPPRAQLSLAIPSSSSSSSSSSADQCGGPLERITIDPTRNCDNYSSSSSSSSNQVRWRDLPNKDQLFILSLCRLSEPLSNVCLLPYIFYLVRSVLPTPSSPSPSPTPPSEPVVVDDSSAAAAAAAARISQYSGLLVAAFPLAQFFVSLPWGRLSDRHGRRTSILGGLLISAVANAAFGLSRSFAALLFWRVVAGLANGNVGILRTVTAEIVRDRRFQTKAFLLLPLVFNSGMVASLALGGCLAEPVVNLPWLFGPRGLLNTGGNPDGVAWALEFPYALPALLNATILAATLILAVLGLEETLPGKEAHDDVGLAAGKAIRRYASRLCWPRRRHHGHGQGHDYVRVGNESAEDMSTAQDEGEKPAEPPAMAETTRRANVPFRVIWTRRVICALVSFGLLPLHNAAFMHIFPVYLSSPPADDNASSEATFFAFTGGLGLRSATIGLWLSCFGVAGILLQLLAYPRMQARIGTRGVFRVALLLFPVTYVAAPYLSLLAAGDRSGGGAARWVFLGLIVCAQIMARTMAIPSTVILLTEAAPSKTVLGTVHGAGNMLASLARAIGPAVGGYVFALGVEEGVIGLVWWLYLVVIALCALAWSYLMEEDEN
ncbi:MFS general substrate transporter [Xylariomycetidae sp. FL2044]|nr:MFS general substrate transporter [Xylariomycetidae sp. FL2044]KAH9883416.1 MFS general substrate transporter [Xylariomycetidae sp. FL2044]KAH9885293.1 MFS general substrate transporter [Xylariomycetidae sp. FL2044]